MLFHIDLWSREARRRERPDVVGLLQDQRTQATSTIDRAYEDLDVRRRTHPGEREEPRGPEESGGRAEEVLQRGPLKRASLPLFLQKSPGRSLEGFDVIDVDEASPDLEGSLILKAPESSRHRLPVRPDHGAKVLVGVAGMRISPGTCTPSLSMRKRIRLASLAGTSLSVTSSIRVS